MNHLRFIGLKKFSKQFNEKFMPGISGSDKLKASNYISTC